VTFWRLFRIAALIEILMAVVIVLVLSALGGCTQTEEGIAGMFAGAGCFVLGALVPLLASRVRR